MTLRTLQITLLFAVILSVGGFATETETVWTDLIEAFDSAQISFNIKGQKLNLRTDANLIHRYFGSRSMDSKLRELIVAKVPASSRSRGESIVTSSIYHFPPYDPVTLPGNLTWGEDPFKSRTWQWSMHNLLAVNQLLGAFRASKNPIFMETAQSLVFDWIQDNLTVDPPSSLSWHDHATAIRLDRLLEFFCLMDVSKLSTESFIKLLSVLHLHGEILSLESFYARHTNHGLKQAQSLFSLGVLLPEFSHSARWREIGLSRIRDELAFSFTSEGIHKENSPSYHAMVLGQVQDIFKLLRVAGTVDPLPKGFENKLYDYLNWMIQPNGKVFLFGDSTRQTISLDIPEHITNRNEVLYTISGGKQGKPSNVTSKCYKESGYVYWRSGWGQQRNYNDEIHFGMKARILSAYHSHADLLTFSLYGFGETWISDGGRFRYEEKDPRRIFLRSLAAHNVVVFGDRQGQEDIFLLNGSRSRISECKASEQAANLKATSQYENIGIHLREVSYVRPFTFLIRDRVHILGKSKLEGFRLLFHFTSNKKVHRLGEAFVIESDDQPGIYLVIAPIGSDISDSGIVKGQEKPKLQGWISTDGLNLEKAPVVFFGAEGKNHLFETLIFFHQGDELTPQRLPSIIQQNLASLKSHANSLR